MTLGGGWYYNSITGSVVDEPPVLGLVQIKTLGWHGPFATKALALAYAAANNGAKPTGLPGAVKNLGTTGVKAGASAVASATGIGGFFQGNIWLRVAEVGLGIILLAVGIAKLTNAVPIATKLAAKVA